MVFITRGPMYLVAVAATGEPVSVLAAQLDLVHMQLIAILTNAVERAFFKSPRFDMRQLLGGTAPVLQVGVPRAFALLPPPGLGWAKPEP